MTRTEALGLISEHKRRLNGALDLAQSQFQVRIAYVGAHEDLLDLTRKIIDEVEEP